MKLFARVSMMLRLMILGLGFAAPAFAKPLAPDDFAYGMDVSFKGGSPLVQLTLPPAVYAAVTRGDLGDVRVFNGAGQVVPHVLQLPASSTQRPVHTLPMFPVYANVDDGADAVKMDVQRDAQGRIVHIDTHQVRRGKRGIVAYVIDATTLNAPIAAFEIEWSAPPADFLGTVSLQASDDLTRWSDVAADAGIASLQFGGERLERGRIEFSPRRAKYFRVVWPPHRPLPDIPVLKFEEAAKVVAPARIWEKVIAHAGAKSGEYVFSLPGHFPADRARVQLLPQANRLVQGQLLTRERDVDPWTSRGVGSIYRLKLGSVTLENPEIVLPGVASRDWLLRLMPAEGLEKVETTIELGWVPHQLVFVATGEGPFRLAYGASEVAPLDDSVRGVLSDVEKKYPAEAVTPATLGEQVALGGPARIASADSQSWRTWALWALLSAAVLALAWMAYRLWRRIDAKVP